MNSVYRGWNKSHFGVLFGQKWTEVFWVKKVYFKILGVSLWVTLSLSRKEKKKMQNCFSKIDFETLLKI
jgi:hypothetical protein